jgi:phosphohistidine phosphatase
MAAQPRTLYIVRHAIAAERGEKWPDDSERPITHEGAARMRGVVQGLAALQVEPDVVITSPLVRAVETAEILVKGVTSTPRLVTSPAFGPGGSPSGMAGALSSLGKGKSMAVVGHEPGLGEFAAWLLGARHPLPFKKGGVCRIELSEWPPVARGGTLIWFATPKMLRGLS